MPDKPNSYVYSSYSANSWTFPTIIGALLGGGGDYETMLHLNLFVDEWYYNVYDDFSIF